MLAGQGIQAEVVDLRTVAPLDCRGHRRRRGQDRRVVVVDEDYTRAGLTGEVAALLLESGIPVKYARVAVEQTIPFAPHLEHAALPNVDRILAAVRGLA